MRKFELHDIICGIILVGLLVLKAIGKDGVIDTLLAAGISFYMGFKIKGSGIK